MTDCRNARTQIFDILPCTPIIQLFLTSTKMIQFKRYISVS